MTGDASCNARLTVRKLATTVRLSDEEIITAVEGIELYVLHRASTRALDEAPLAYLERVKIEADAKMRAVSAALDEAVLP